MTLLTHQQTKLQRNFNSDAAGGEEDHTNNSIDIVSNGFVLDPGSDSGNVQYTNTNNVSFFYITFAEHPLTTARAR